MGLLFLFIYYTKRVFRTLLNILLGGEPCLCCGKKVIIYPICRQCHDLYFYQNLEEVEKEDEEDKKKREEKSKKEEKEEKDSVIKSVDTIYALTRYEGVYKTLIVKWKLHGYHALSLFYALLCKQVIDKLLTFYPSLVVVPTPPRPFKIYKTGFDQVADLTYILKYRYHLPVKSLLIRKTYKEKKGMTGKERVKNMGSNYRLISKKVPPIVCIVDDIVTTGSTIEEIAKILKENGAKIVIVLALARAC